MIIPTVNLECSGQFAFEGISKEDNFFRINSQDEIKMFSSKKFQYQLLIAFFVTFLCHPYQARSISRLQCFFKLKDYVKIAYANGQLISLFRKLNRIFTYTNTFSLGKTHVSVCTKKRDREPYNILLNKNMFVS